MAAWTRRSPIQHAQPLVSSTSTSSGATGLAQHPQKEPPRLLHRLHVVFRTRYVLNEHGKQGCEMRCAATLVVGVSSQRHWEQSRLYLCRRRSRACLPVVRFACSNRLQQMRISVFDGFYHNRKGRTMNATELTTTALNRRKRDDRRRCTVRTTTLRCTGADLSWCT